MSLISKIWRKLQDKEYRDGYTEAQLSIEIPFQVRALREARGWTQAELAKRCGMPQARISHIEQPGRDPLSVRTLYRLSSAFDIGLLVQFVSFSELVAREAAFDPKTFSVPSFAEDRYGEALFTTDKLMMAKPLLTLPKVGGWESILVPKAQSKKKWKPRFSLLSTQTKPLLTLPKVGGWESILVPKAQSKKKREMSQFTIPESSKDLYKLPQSDPMASTKTVFISQERTDYASTTQNAV